ncbi:hypothetical protein [Dawidia soli]|uniref:Uncharacterized protein n=1 Tax=Dawidia soli TaxID=2782352 RepID=A0AAP2DGH1_9BACT|nr:hypothetical protein [Dawidia soli]MBT1690656.1 hypothetical protein [Dawidia soli]
MENSEQRKQIRELGKLFVKELDLADGVDTFSKWMAYYIAEKMKTAESLPPGDARDAAEKECFETILKLWARRGDLPASVRPLREFEPVLRIIERLDPDHHDPFFYRSTDAQILEAESKNPAYDKIKEVLETVLKIDKVARIWIETLLHGAVKLSSNEETKAWLETAVNVDDPYQLPMVEFIVDQISASNDANVAEKARDYEEKLVRQKIEQMKEFEKLNAIIIAYFQDAMSEDGADYAALIDRIKRRG